MMMLVGLLQPIMRMTIAVAMATMAVNDSGYNGEQPVIAVRRSTQGESAVLQKRV